MKIDFTKRNNDVINLSSSINSLLVELKKQKAKRFSYWYEAVGERISKIAIPKYKKHDILFVSVQDSVSRFELTRMKQSILEKVNSKLEENKKLKDIIFK